MTHYPPKRAVSPRAAAHKARAARTMKNTTQAASIDQADAKVLPLNLSQEHGRGKVSQILAAASARRACRQGSRQHVERKHVAGEEEVEQHVDEQQRADFQNQKPTMPMLASRKKPSRNEDHERQDAGGKRPAAASRGNSRGRGRTRGRRARRRRGNRRACGPRAQAAESRSGRPAERDTS